MVTDGHLGGYVLGGDPATYYPDLWRWFVTDLDVLSVLDVGCGEGHALDFFSRNQCLVQGVDGIEQAEPYITQHDFTQGPWRTSVIDEFDLVWCCEFVEHVEERYVPNFLETFELGRYVAMTHAEPGHGGYHHVNCQPSVYWVGALAAIGFQIDYDLTKRARDRASLNKDPYNHFVRSGIVFTRAPS